MRKYLISIDINTGPFASFIDQTIHIALTKRSSYVCVANVHMVVEAHKDDNFATVVNEADLVTPDGMPLCFALKWLYGIKQDRVAGMFYMQALMGQAAIEGLPVYFYGGTQKLLDTTKVYCEENYPDLTVAGMYSPPFRPLNAEEEQQVIDNINNSGAKIVFVALGCPKQEKWMASMKNRINACMIGIGGALPVMVGLKLKAPMWIQRSGLEWGFRLLQEPGRLYKRYWDTIPFFMRLLFQELRSRQ